MDTRRLAAFQTGRRETPDSARVAVLSLPIRRFGRNAWLAVPWLLVAGLLYFALRKTPWTQVTELLEQLNPGAISILLGLNLVFLFLVNLRWWLLLRSLGWKVPLLALVTYRLAGSGISYFTPGPQLGGEPLQVHLLHTRMGVSLEDALSSVFFDRLVDGLANFTFLLIGCLIGVTSGMLAGYLPSWIWVLALGLFIFPAGHLLALRLDVRPATWLVSRLNAVRLKGAQALVAQSEAQISRLIQEKPGVLVAVLFVSLLVWIGALLEFWLCLRYLGIQASLSDAIGSLTLARFAFLVPVPGGLGALETSQRFAAQLLGWGAAAGIAISLVIRARDSFFALIGLGLGAVAYRSYFLPKKAVVVVTDEPWGSLHNEIQKE
jgi:glycosyltransferase 2 family protein